MVNSILVNSPLVNTGLDGKGLGNLALINFSLRFAGLLQETLQTSFGFGVPLLAIGLLLEFYPNQTKTNYYCNCRLLHLIKNVKLYVNYMSLSIQAVKLQEKDWNHLVMVLISIYVLKVELYNNTYIYSSTFMAQIEIRTILSRF